MQPDPKKVEVIKSLQQPTTVKQVCSIIGACSYYHRFIPNFSGIAEPIIKLTRKYAKFHWTPECDKAFQYYFYLFRIRLHSKSRHLGIGCLPSQNFSVI
jgi:hypothetical protein